MSDMDALIRARRAVKRAVRAQKAAEAARAERDEAVVAAFRSGVSAPTLADAVGLKVDHVRKMIFEASRAATTEET